MTIPAASSAAVRNVVFGRPAPAQWLGASASALYLLTGSGTVLAVVSSDAVRLPCALVLASRAGQLPLNALAPRADQLNGAAAAVGAGCVRWTGMAGPVSVRAVREWAPARVVGTPVAPRPLALGSLAAALDGHDFEVEPERVSALAASGMRPQAQYAATAALLGRGPGLTPSGDDVVAGFLLGARAFGRPAPGAAAAVNQLATSATTALSAQLLRDAVRGDCIAQVAAVVAALTTRSARGAAFDRLLAVGHTSGVALGAGLLAAAGMAASVGRPPEAALPIDAGLATDAVRRTRPARRRAVSNSAA